MTKKKNLWIYALQSRDGYTYSLELETEHLIKAEHPNAVLAERLFLDQDITRNFATTQQNIAPHIIALLTQLPPEEIAALGPWEFREPDEDKLLFTWPGSPSAEKTAPNPGTKKTIAPTQKPPRSSQRKAAG